MSAGLLSAGLLLSACSPSDRAASAADGAGRYAALDKLPDLAGYWTRAGGGPPDADLGTPDLLPEAAAELARRQEMVARGTPVATDSTHCWPSGGAGFYSGPSAIEIAMLPDKVILWGNMDSDGNNIRRVHTDGRQHSTDPDPLFMGESIGGWEGDILVVDTIAFLPSALAAPNVPSGGDMHVIERLHLTGPDALAVDVEITAPHVLKSPFKFTRNFERKSGAGFEAREAVCAQGGWVDQVDAGGIQYLDTTPPPDLVLPSNTN